MFVDDSFPRRLDVILTACFYWREKTDETIVNGFILYFTIDQIEILYSTHVYKLHKKLNIFSWVLDDTIIKYNNLLVGPCSRLAVWALYLLVRFYLLVQIFTLFVQV